jgi:amino acid transporter
MAAADATSAQEYSGERDTELRRAISGRLLFFFILGDILGGGIYSLPGEVAAEVGGAIWVPFSVAFVLALLTACSYAELVTKYPLAAGAALYVHKAFRMPFVTFMVAFLVMASGVTSASALAKAFSGDYFATFFDLPIIGISLVFIAIVAAINLRGISESVTLNAAFTVIEVIGLLIIIVVGIVALTGGTGDPGRAMEFKEGAAPLSLIIAGTTLSFYALIGFEDSVNVAEETRNPSRTYPRALFAGMIVAGIVYLLVTFTSAMVVEIGTLSGSDAPLLEVIKAGPVSIPLTLFSIIALFALSNGALINMIMASRLVYGMANQGIVPRLFTRILPGRRTPWASIVLTTAFAVVLIITGDLGVLADTTVMLLLIVFAMVNISALVLRRENVEHEHFHAPTAAPVIGALVALFLITQNESDIYLRAGIIVVVGLLFWVINRMMSGPAEEMQAEKFGA